LNLWKSFAVPETRVFQAADSEDLVILACTIFDWSTRVTDGQTELRWNYELWKKQKGVSFLWTPCMLHIRHNCLALFTCDGRMLRAS